MYKTVIAVIFSGALIVGCAPGLNNEPAPTVTVTQEVPKSAPTEEFISNEQRYVDFVKSNGGLYASAANDQGLINLGEIVCDGYSKGMSQNEIIQALSYALTENGMDNEEGAKFGAAIILGAERYLCSSGVA